MPSFARKNRSDTLGGSLGGRIIPIHACAQAEAQTPGARSVLMPFWRGTERSFDNNARLGFHRFYQVNALTEPTAKLFTGKGLGDAQITTAALGVYLLKMGVDPSVISLASEAGPNEMR